ncbi:MAG: hypothetical protein U0270_38975 [Labilithrix sp.]
MSALAVAKLARRKDLRMWIDHYAQRCASCADLERVWPRLLTAIR